MCKEKVQVNYLLKQCFTVPLLIAMILFFTACGGGGHRLLVSDELDSAVERVRTGLEARINKTVPSLSVLIQTPNGTYFASSVAQGVEQVTPDTYFRFASNTKTFTATAILKMHQDGWLDISSLITATIPGASIPYVPDTPAWNIPYKNSITIEKLLQHDAGVYDVDNESRSEWGGMSYVGQQLTLDPLHQFSADELVGQLTLLNLKYFAPGTDNKYSNTGYTFLSEIIARVYSARAGSAKTYSDYLYDHVIGGLSPVPLSMIKFPHLAADNTLPTPLCIR